MVQLLLRLERFVSGFKILIVAATIIKVHVFVMVHRKSMVSEIANTMGIWRDQVHYILHQH